MIRTKKRMRLCITLTVCCLVFIWGNSLMSAEISSAMSDFFKKIVKSSLSDGTSDALDISFLVRKSAHFTEFTVLGMCLCWLFGMLKKGIAAPFLWGTAAGCLDEFIQRLVPERGPSLRDVCIDACGVLLGVILLTLGHHYLCKKRTMEET